MARQPFVCDRAPSNGPQNRARQSRIRAACQSALWEEAPRVQARKQALQRPTSCFSNTRRYAAQAGGPWGRRKYRRKYRRHRACFCCPKSVVSAKSSAPRGGANTPRASTSPKKCRKCWFRRRNAGTWASGDGRDLEKGVNGPAFTPPPSRGAVHLPRGGRGSLVPAWARLQTPVMLRSARPDGLFVNAFPIPKPHSLPWAARASSWALLPTRSLS